MNEKVQDFLDQQEHLQELHDQKYYYLIMQYANLMSNESDFIEVTKEEYNEVLLAAANDAKKEDGRYYIKKQLPLDITEEEFASVEASIPKEKLADLRVLAVQSQEDKEAEKSGSATFFTIIAWLLFIGGLIIAISTSLTTEEYGYYSKRDNFNFALCVTSYLPFFISGCFSLCAAELFKKLQTIVNILRRKE